MSSATEELLGGRYRLVRPIGHGGMADVHLAEDLRLDRQVAVKVLREQTGDVGAQDRFAAEATTLARLSHPALVTLLDTGTWVERPYIVFEYVDGQDLAKLLDEGPLDPGVVRRAARDVADALAYAHGLGIVHRDIKPANILLRPDGRAQLADFGIARLLDQTAQHTSASQLIGSPAYLSPEQFRGDPISTATDVYSLGLVILEALSGKRPAAGTPAEIAAARFTTPAAVPDDLAGPWRELLEEMTRREPEARPTAAGVTERLDGLLDDAWERGDRTAVLTDVGPTVVLAASEPWGEQLRRQVDRGLEAVSPVLADAGERVRRVRPPSRRVAVALGVGAAALLTVIAIAVSGDDVATPPADPDVPAEYQQQFDDLYDAIHGDR